MLARLALDTDEDIVTELVKMQVEETLPHLHFDEVTTRNTFRRYLKTANPTIFVVEDQRKVVGYLVALINDYAFTTGHFVNQEVLYVKPEKRGSRAAARLIDIFNAWADRLEAREVFMGVANGFRPERTVAFMEHFGFTQVGAQLRRIGGLHESLHQDSI